MERQINKERVFGNRRHRFYSWWWTDEGEEEWEEEEDDGQTIITTIRRRKKKVCSLGFKQEQFIQGISKDWFSTFVLGGRSLPLQTGNSCSTIVFIVGSGRGICTVARIWPHRCSAPLHYRIKLSWASLCNRYIFSGFSNSYIQN